MLLEDDGTIGVDEEFVYGVDMDEGGVGVQGIVIRTVVVAVPGSVDEELVYGTDIEEGGVGV